MGHAVNGVRQSTIADSKAIWGLKTPSIAPGRYLGHFLWQPELNKHPAAVLECAFSCARRGLGYRYHKVGVFLNVFEDHIDPQGWIKSKQDLAEAKSFIFSSIADNGWAVFNADDEFVCASLTKLPTTRTVHLLPCGLTFKSFDLKSHLDQGGVAVTVAGTDIVLLHGTKKTVLCNMKQLPWTYDGTYLPSVWNLMHACAAVYGFYDGTLPDSIQRTIEDRRLNTANGRLLVVQTENKPTIIADYAHEKVSLVAVAELARTFLNKSGKVIGVVRLNHERPDTVIRETGYVIADAYDQLIVYDKIDGFWRHPVPSAMKRYPQVSGRTSELLSAAIKERNPQVTRIIREDLAVRHAASIAKPGDVVVIIINDNVTQSLEFIREAFAIEIG